MASRRQCLSTGWLTAVQEERFRLRTSDGRSGVFTLGRGAACTPEDLDRWRSDGVRVLVRYEGEPNLDSCVADRVEPVARGEAPGAAVRRG